jgi:hypothetical protein
VSRRRWKIEHVGPTAQGVHLKLKPANERWTMEGDVWFDQESGMPKKLRLSGGFVGAGGDVNVVRLAENTAVPDEVFKPTPPDPEEGWEINRHPLAQPEDANEAVRILGRLDGAVAAAEPPKGDVAP